MPRRACHGQGSVRAIHHPPGDARLCRKERDAGQSGLRGVEAANKAVGQFQGQAQAAQSGASEIAHKSIAYAEQNFAATFDFAQKLMNAKDAAEVLGLQSEYLSRQMLALSTQVRDLGQSAAKIVVDAAKPKA